MLLKRSLMSLVFMAGFLISAVSFAQQSDTSIVGQWKQRGDSVYIDITKDGSVMVAKVVRNDWKPGLVGQNLFTDIKANGNKKWVGSGLVPKLGERRGLRLSLNKKGYLVSYVKGGARKRLEWSRVEN